jgi:hypothetical protein
MQPLRYVPYRLHNAIGLPIRYALHQKNSHSEQGNRSDATTVSSTLFRAVDVDAEVSLVDTETLLRQRLSSVMRYLDSVIVTVHIPPFESLRLPLYAPSYTIVPLHPQPNPQMSLQLVWEVFKPGVRRLRTAIRFVNALTTTASHSSVVLVLHSKYLKGGSMRHVLPPGTDWPLPLSIFLHLDEVRVSLHDADVPSELFDTKVPSSQERETRGRTRTRVSRRSAQTLPTSSSETEETKETEKTGAIEEAEPFVLNDLLQHDKVKFVAPYLLRVSGSFTEGDVTIFIDTQLSVENLLPLPLTLEIRDLCVNRKLFSDVSLVSGNVLPLPIIHPSHALAMAICLPGFARSEEVLIRPGVGSAVQSGATTVKVYDERHHSPLVLHIEYTAGDATATVQRIVVFCAYWLLNRTGLPLRFRDVASNSLLPSSPLEASDNHLRLISLMSQAAGTDMRREWYDNLPATTLSVLYGPDTASETAELRVAVADGTWSLPLRLNSAAGWREVVELPTALGLFSFTMSIHLAPAPYSRTKVVSFLPRYVLYNSLSVPLYYRQLNCTAYYTLGPGEYVPWHWTHSKSRQLCVTLGTKEDVAAGRCPWSGGILLDRVGEVALNLRDVSLKRIVHLLRVDIRLGEGGSHIVAVRAASASIPPYRIDNHTRELLLVYQEGHRECSLQLGPYESQPFAWEYPAESHVLWVEFPQRPNLTPRAYPLDDITEFAPITIYGPSSASYTSSSSSLSLRSTSASPEPRSRTPYARSLSRSLRYQGNVQETVLAIAVSLDGPTRVLTLRDLTLHCQLTSDIPKAITPSTRIPHFMEPRERHVPMLRVHIAFPALSVQLKSHFNRLADSDNDTENDEQRSILLQMDNAVEDSSALCNLIFDAPTVDYRHTSAAHSVEVQIVSAQIDNPSLTTSCPVILTTTTCRDRPWLHIVVVKSHHYPDIDYFHYVALSLQELTISLDMDWLNTMLHCLYDFAPPADSLAAIPSLPMLPENVRFIDKRVYLKLLHIDPMKVNLTFVSGSSSPSISPSPTNLAAVLLRTAGLSVANIDKVTFHLNALIVPHPYMTRTELFTLITRHYMMQLLKQAYRVLGAFDVIGSPFALFSTLGTGVYDFFYEPAQSLVTRPQDFIKGIARGTASLLSKSAFALLNSLTKITSSLSKVTATLSLDPTCMTKTANVIAAVSLNRTVHFEGTSTVSARMPRGVAGLLARRTRTARHSSRLQGLAYNVMGFVFKPLTGLFATIMQHSARARNALGSVAFGVHTLAAPHRRIAPPCAHLLSHLLYSLHAHHYRDHHYRSHWYTAVEHTLYLLSDQALFTLLLTPTTYTVISVIWLRDLRQVQANADVTQAVLHYTTSRSTDELTSPTLHSSSPSRSDQLQWRIHLPKNRARATRILIVLEQASLQSPSSSKGVSQRTATEK